MAHIASCMRPSALIHPVYIPRETTSKMTGPKEDNVPSLPLLKSPSLASLIQPTVSKYQLFPSTKHTTRVSKPAASSDRAAALNAGRSSTSLSDTAVMPESLPLWQRTGSDSLARRRKISVPELRNGKPMATVNEMVVDSPTIPGRPPLRAIPQEVLGHERSYSASSTIQRSGSFDDALLLPGPTNPPSSRLVQHTPTASGDSLHIPRAPLSPILSPSLTPKPALTVNTTTFFEDADLPPRVPPKSPTRVRTDSPKPSSLSSKGSKTNIILPISSAPGEITSAPIITGKWPGTGPAPLPTPPSSVSGSYFTSSPASVRESPRPERNDRFAPQLGMHNRNASESSIMDRGRPPRRNNKRQRSRTCSESNEAESPAPNGWQLPRGMPLTEASRRMSDTDKKTLHKQACDQADNFEVLSKRDVASVSRELRALDERCEYLRKTYKSLRAGRQKLHDRMIAYLKRGETMIFSRESLLKQEEALAELDVSIDEFINKLEQAENRRLRLRQKLLEHVAAAIVLSPTLRGSDIVAAQTTPPRSPERSPVVKVEKSPAVLQRKETESIKIYADGHVLNLFSDIEKAIGQMCEEVY